jgi:hypothetical protein
MKKLGTWMFAVVAAASLAVPFASAADKQAGSPAACLEALKKLAGDWVTVDKDGKATDQVMSSIKVTAGGSAVHETEFPGTEHEMVTIYYLDGNDLVLTHYCMLGNQPHMKAEPTSTPNRLVFKFAGGSNLNAEKDNHMHEAVIEIPDDQHIKSEWTRCEGGKACEKHGFALVRKQK